MPTTWIYILLATHTYLAFANQLPSDIQKCHFGDVKCLANSMNYVIKHYGKTGIPAIKLPSLSAVYVSNVTFIQDDHSRSVWYDGEIHDTLIKGTENTTITKVLGFGIDPHGSDSEIHGLIPSVVATAKFNFKYKIFNLPFVLTGISAVDLQNFRFKLKMSFVRDNRGYVKIYKLAIKTTADRWIIDLQNVKSENTDLTVLITEWINENWSELWQDAEPTVRAKIHEVFSKVFNDIFSTIRYEDMFLKTNN